MSIAITELLVYYVVFQNFLNSISKSNYPIFCKKIICFLLLNMVLLQIKAPSRHYVISINKLSKRWTIKKSALSLFVYFS